MRPSVVDENVLRTANGEASHAGDACALECVKFLQRCVEDQDLLIDTRYEILDTYGESCSRSGQPGAGDEFYRWAVETASSLQQIELRRDAAGDYVDFPITGLPAFDRDDRKWVALAVAAGPHSQIVNAVDSDYKQHASEFDALGIDVVELCPEELK